MSKTFFNLSEQKQHIINFVKKHKDILCICEGDEEITEEITDEFISNFEKTNNREFVFFATSIQLNFGDKYYLFDDNCKNHNHMMLIWLPKYLSKNSSDKAIKEFCGNLSFKNAIESFNCDWYNMTPKRWEAFEAIFDFYDKPKTSAKKTTKKVVKPAEVKLDDYNIVKNGIAFIDFDAEEFEHLMCQGGENVDPYISKKSKCSADNQIDHVINAFKVAKKEADSFIELLEKAKKNGAKYVVDSSYEKPTYFDFDN